MAHPNNDKDHYTSKPPIFDGDKFDYWEDRIESFFIGCDTDLWNMVIDGYTHHIDANGTKLKRSKMNEHQKKDHKNHHKSRTILLNVISYSKYNKITNRHYAKYIFDYLKMTHERNEQVKETKALALIQKYKAFKVEEDEMIEGMFSRFKNLVARLKVLNKGYTTIDQVNKIIINLPKKWWPMVKALKMLKNLNNTTLEELISSLRSHGIKLEDHEPHKKVKYVALKSKGKPEKAKSL